MSELEWIETFAGNLTEIIKESGYSQREIADITGIMQSTLIHITIILVVHFFCRLEELRHRMLFHTAIRQYRFYLVEIIIAVNLY